MGKVLTIKHLLIRLLKRKIIKSFENSFELRVKSPTDSEGKRKIYKVIREITDADRRKNSDIPQNAKYKTQLPSGIEYFTTRD